MNIQAISFYLPDTYLTNEKIVSQNPEWSVDKISKKTGIYKRPIAGGGVLSSDLAFYAAKRLFETANVDKGIIDFLLFFTNHSVFVTGTFGVIR
jgi:3-oxoacyl-[acyl-carrier-protein] synthase-3